MKFTNPNTIDRDIRDWTGETNPDDIWHFDPSLEKTIEELPENIETRFSKKEPTEKLLSCLEKTIDFCKTTSDVLSTYFEELINEYNNDRVRISESMLEYLKSKNLLAPKFTILTGEEANEKTKDLNLYWSVSEEDVLLVFQLPKPLAHFWWKGGTDSWGALGQDVKGNIEWGEFYRKVMELAWSVQGYYENEEGLDFFRLNDIGQHNPDEYYYVWNLSTRTK